MKGGTLIRNKKWLKAFIIALLFAIICSLLLYGRFYWPAGGSTESSLVQEESNEGDQGQEEQGGQGEKDIPIDTYPQHVTNVEYIEQASEGLELFFTAEIRFENGDRLVLDRLDMHAPADAESYIMLDLQRLELLALPFDIHGGAVQIGRVTTATDEVEALELEEDFEIPPSKLGTTHDRIHGPGDDDEGANVAVFSRDSHSDLSGLGVLDGDDGVPIHADSFAFQPEQPQWGMVYTESPTDDETPPSPLALDTEQYDLAVFELALRTDDMYFTYVENVLRNFRQAEMDVLLLTPAFDEQGQPIMELENETTVQAMEEQMEVLVEMAETWGVEMVDTASYVSYGRLHETRITGEANNGADSSQGNVTMDPEQWWLSAVHSVLVERDHTEQTDIPEETFVVTAGQTEAGHPFPTELNVLVEPLEDNGTVVEGEGDLDLTQLEPGQYAHFNHENGQGVDLIIERSTVFEAELLVGDTDFVIDRVSYDGETAEDYLILEGIGMDRYVDFPNLDETGIDIHVTSGTLRLAGAGFYQH